MLPEEALLDRSRRRAQPQPGEEPAARLHGLGAAARAVGPAGRINSTVG